MNLYKIAPSLPFLDVVANFILNTFDQNTIDQLKVILPNGLTCLNLQKILIEKKNIAILPNIIPLSNIIAEGEEIFKISPERLEPIKSLEEKIILAEIIYNYPKLQYTIVQSLQFCSSLAQLFYELNRNNLSIEFIDNIKLHNQSEHWQSIYDFLKYTHKEWQRRLAELKKQDLAHYQRDMMEAEIKRLQKEGANLIVAGIFGYDHLTWNFLNGVARSQSGFIILPPIGGFHDSLALDNTSPEGDALYYLKQLLKVLDKKLSDFKHLGGYCPQHDIFDQLLCHSEGSKPEESPTTSGDSRLAGRNDDDIAHISYIEFENIFQEAKQISLICKEHPDKKIAIIVNNQKTKEFYANFLAKYSLEFQDLLGSNISKSHICQLLIAISEIICNEFDIKKLFLLLKNPLMNSVLAQKLELPLLGKNRFILSPDQMLMIIEQTADSELIEYCKNLINCLYGYSGNTFNSILKSVIKIAQKLCANIWYEESAIEISKFLNDLIKLNWQLALKKKENFPKILRGLVSGLQYFDNNYPANIVLGKAEDMALLKFDLVILADFSLGNWPPVAPINPFLSIAMQKELGLTISRVSSSIYLYYFYLLLTNDNVIITRSKKQDSKSALLPSNYFLKLQLILGNSLNVITNVIKSEVIRSDAQYDNNPLLNSKIAHSLTFPNILSVTDIEMLVRSPYSFYAKKILNLKSKDMIGEDPKISEFGNFIHNVLERYSKNYDIKEDNNHKLQVILDISNDILQDTILSLYTKKIWQTKFKPIAEAFIEFDETRRNSAKYVYSELKGEMLLNIVGQEIKIIGVADRIEVDEQGQAIILDYKTGSVPTKKDVESGLSPQLIIESLMIQDGGFEIEAREVKKIIYVKISSSHPHINTTEIALTNEELMAHRRGMISLLEYYVTNKQFSSEIDLLKYNDYLHLARKSKSYI